MLFEKKIKCYVVTDEKRFIVLTEQEELIYAIDCFASEGITKTKLVIKSFTKKQLDEMEDLMLDSDGIFKQYIK